MKRQYSVAVIGCAAFLCAFALRTERALGQDVWTLGFEGSTAFSGNAGERKDDVYFTTITHAGTGANVQGWSYGAVAEGATINAVTLTGTASEIAYVGGFDSTELVTAAKNPGVASGMVSAVVLHLKKGTTLPANSTSRVARMDVSVPIPAGGGVARLLYKDGLTGSGEPVPIVVTQGGDSRTAELTPLAITLTEVVSCCTAVANVGFSAARVSGGPGVGVIDGSDLCIASGGEIVIESGEGETGVATVYGNITSNITAGGGIQGWSYGVALNGEGHLVAGSATLTGTFAEIAYVGGFDSTEIIDPAKQTPPGQEGIVSAVVLHLKKGTTLPLLGTESVITFQVAAAGPQGEADQIATLKYQSGLVGSGEPVPNVITIGGDSATACNFDLASVNLRFTPSSSAEFLRGDANGQRGVDIADPIWIVNELFKDGPPSPCQAAGDANDDGLYDAADAIYLIDYLFRASALPPPPFPVCGPDPTPDTPPLPCGTSC